MVAGLQPVPRLPKKHPKMAADLAAGSSKLCVVIDKYREIVVGGTGLEPVPIVSYLVKKCYKVSYLYGYYGHMWSCLVTNIHIVLNVFCGRIVGKTGNFVGRMISYVFKTFLCL